ncbi:hypothetical protein [Streptomyces sp. SP18BB07]|uniref:hypothetical protein n=1 Tax=Streptomyces sp. SP18BB07 TaxID=3002522 RepID=UPI002E75CBE5|nr:hypothetical protein [Streptomyces sp. SP18BB07]MEE1761315.1 hypothetical protein [Streptomyces sp. SP18BB07]
MTANTSDMPAMTTWNLWPRELDAAPEAVQSAHKVAVLKFYATLPPRLAEAPLAARLADLGGATAALRGPARFTVPGR